MNAIMSLSHTYLILLVVAFGQLFLNHMRTCVCVPARSCCCHLIEVIVINLLLLLSHTSLILFELEFGQIFFNRMRMCVCVAASCSLGMSLR